MTLLSLLVAVVILVLVLWVVRTLLPLAGLPPQVHTIIYVVVVVIAVLWFLMQLGGTSLGVLR